jgi:hypothetical protein
MKQLVALEEWAQFVFSIALYYLLGYKMWLFFVLLFVPDISMLGYLVNNRIGAISYNVFHHKGIALVVFVLGYILHLELLIMVGIILYAHSCLDRGLGYGLKYYSNFQDTHLGKIGKNES